MRLSSDQEVRFETVFPVHPGKEQTICPKTKARTKHQRTVNLFSLLNGCKLINIDKLKRLTMVVTMPFSEWNLNDIVRYQIGN